MIYPLTFDMGISKLYFNMIEKEKIRMEHIKYHGVAMGGKIYSLRMARKMSQEELAAILNISPAAVSKWERNLSNPSIDMLWMLADYFECSIDELIGRTLMQVEKVGNYDEKRLRLVIIGEDLLKCSEIRHSKGLRGMGDYVPELKGESRFLAFAIPYIQNLFMKQIESDEVFRFLENYVSTLPKEEQAEGNMIVAALGKIYAGESSEILRELIASYVGMDYREKEGRMAEMLNNTRQEILKWYDGKEVYSNRTNLLEEFTQVGNFEIQSILRNLDALTLTVALKGASGRVVKVFLSNLSDKMLSFLHEDMKKWNGTEEEIISAQEKVLEVGNFFLNNEKQNG